MVYISVQLVIHRYGLQLYGATIQSPEDPLNSELEKLQIAQNNMMRSIENIRFKDKVSIKSLLEKNRMLSVNQTMAQIKLTEMWKCKFKSNYPLQPPIVLPITNGTTTRSAATEKFKINNSPKTFIGDATRLWNLAPITVTNAINLKAAKKCKIFLQ